MIDDDKPNTYEGIGRLIDYYGDVHEADFHREGQRRRFLQEGVDEELYNVSYKRVQVGGMALWEFKKAKREKKS